MAKAKNPPQNAVGTSHGVLKNQIGTLKGDGAKCGAKFAETPHVIYVGVTGVRSEGEDPAELEFCHGSYLNRHSHRGRRLH